MNGLTDKCRNINLIYIITRDARFNCISNYSNWNVYLRFAIRLNKKVIRSEGREHKRTRGQVSTYLCL
jgi:hypothetical protein